MTKATDDPSIPAVAKSNVLRLKDERKRRQKQAKPKTKRKRGRPPTIDIDVAFKLKAEVAEKQKAGLRKNKAIASLIGDDAPHSWWWDKNAPVKFVAAHRRYHRAVNLLEGYEKEHGQAYEPMSLARLGEKAGIKPSEQPPETIEQMTAAMLDHKRRLYENKDGISQSRLLDFKRNFRRRERRLVRFLKEYAASIGKKIATDGPKHPPEKVRHALEALKEFDGRIADFEEKVTKIERGGSLILLGKPE